MTEEDSKQEQKKGLELRIGVLRSQRRLTWHLPKQIHNGLYNNLHCESKTHRNLLIATCFNRYSPNSLYPELDGISQMLATFDVYVASEVQINGEIFFYAVLGLSPLADDDAIKKQYRKLELILHPDENKTVGTDGEFKLVSEAWTLLSDSVKRSSYDLGRSKPSSANVIQTNSPTVNPVSNGSSNCSKSSVHNQPNSETFWTVCTSCKVQYEYLRKYVNNDRLSCKNCQKTFVAVETGKAPAGGSIPLYSWSFVPENVHGNQGFSGITYLPTNTIFFTGTAVPDFYSGFGSEYPNMSFQWSPFPGTSAGIVGAHGSTTQSASVVHHTNDSVQRTGEKVKTAAREKGLTQNVLNATSCKKLAVHAEPPFNKAIRPDEKRKIDESTFRNGLLPTGADLGASVNKSVSNGHGSISISGRSEDCFNPKQIWAMYDEEDGIPCLYCLIRQVISVKPFKIQISYLNSKSDSEFGSVNWIDSGFTKSCGNFRAWNSDVIDQVNIFSHVLYGMKPGRGGCIRVFPKRGYTWAVYRHLSPDWNRSTPAEVRHHYEMVEVLGDYTEELGVCAVYQNNMDSKAIRWIPRREMLRFSHQVPSWSLKEISNLPEGYWDLDPAATPDR
uniref:J domain-containing protein n=1 Tax=Nelumbo nucifera TaxID=4432 RepID=A0A822XRY7_NELNU|nr:TPA_asm: hypothetical protein HUJ06_021721 [Nelumbo nucifera]